MFIKKILLFTLLLCLCASSSYANAGIPVFAFLPTIVQNMAAGLSLLDLGYTFELEDPVWIWMCVQFLFGVVISFLLLICVVSVEYGYLLQKLPKIEPKVLKKEVWHGNLITTLIGFSF